MFINIEKHDKEGLKCQKLKRKKVQQSGTKLPKTEKLLIRNRVEDTFCPTNRQKEKDNCEAAVY
jgi:hypothetical protein